MSAEYITDLYNRLTDLLSRSFLDCRTLVGYANSQRTAILCQVTIDIDGKPIGYGRSFYCASLTTKDECESAYAAIVQWCNRTRRDIEKRKKAQAAVQSMKKVDEDQITIRWCLEHGATEDDLSAFWDFGGVMLHAYSDGSLRIHDKEESGGAALTCVTTTTQLAKLLEALLGET